jgi:hypothetical protein
LPVILLLALPAIATAYRGGQSGSSGPAPGQRVRRDPAVWIASGAERTLLCSAAMQRLRQVLVASVCAVIAVGCAAEVDDPGQGDGGGGGGADAGDERPDGGSDSSRAVSMENLVVQSQVEPFRGNQPDLPGDAAVEAVQRALGEEGFGVAVDGWFGSETASVYADWQSSLGYSGLGANGIPGPSSLAALGEGRFAVKDEIQIGSHTTFSGRTVNQRTRDMLVEAQSLLGFDIVLSQGSYNAGGVDASAGTHDGGGAADVSVSSLSTTQRWETVKALRTVGFAAWLRTPDQGPWPYHIHAIAIGDTDVSIAARDQVADYYIGKNGLASHAADNTPDAYKAPFTWWEKYK